MGCGASFDNTGLYSFPKKNTGIEDTLTKIIPILNYQKKRPSSINTRISLSKKFLVG
jgi:hypothetical protein